MVRKIITYSTLFPSRSRPINGLFVAELVKSLASSIQVSVIAPVIAHQNLKESWYGQRKYYFSDTIEVKAPFSLNFPKILKSTDGYLMAACTRQAFKKSVDENTDLVHAHFAYPDAVAAGILAAEVRLPLVVTVHGSDINVLAKDLNRRHQILKTLQSANAVITVASDLKRKVIELGVSEEFVYHVPNGVDISKFCPGNKVSARKKLGLDHYKRLLLTVGNLVPVKAFDRLIIALSHLEPDIGLLLVGEGHERARLERLAQTLSLEERVQFAGAVKHDELSVYYQAADFLVISSHSEGWPTVIYEALACGTPIIANGVGGIPEALSSSELGLLMRDNDYRTIVQAISTAYERDWKREAAVSIAKQHSWDEIARQYLAIYEKVSS
jgi:glycosyltransferase involved in cell wall biosynthesis